MPKALSEEMKQQVINLCMNYNYNQQEVADYLGIGYSTVHRIISEYSKDGSHEPPKGMPMPERAVPAVPIEEVTQPVVMTEEHTAAIPEAVISAVESKVADLRKEIQRNAEQAESLLRHNDNYIKRIEILEKWLSDVQDA